MGGNEEVEYMHLFKEACMDEDRREKEKFTSVKSMKTTRKIWKEDGCNWAALIKKMMLEHKNLYTDISSTVTHLDDKNGLVLKNIKEWLETKNDKNASDVGPLKDRILFGTDFFMTEMSKKESRLYSLMQRELGEFYPQMRQENIDRYLYGKGE
jgi:hypothetical protein